MSARPVLVAFALILGACGGGDAGPDAFPHVCEQGDIDCDGQRVLRCQSGNYLRAELCDDTTTCEPTQGCVEQCEAGASAICSGNAVYTCNEDGTRGALREQCPNGPCADGRCTIADATWQAYRDARAGYLTALGAPILDCVARDDEPAHAAFHGCRTWSDAVAGVWALRALARLTGDASYRTAADAVLTEDALASELDDLQGGALDTERPYGFAWLLRLAREDEQDGGTRLSALGVAAADALETYLDGLTPEQLAAGIVAGDASNVSWLVFNLWQWAQWKLDTARADRLVIFARSKLKPTDAACPLDADQAQPGFFAPCLARVRTIVALLPTEEATEWLSNFAPNAIPMTPIETPTPSTQAGLTFARAQGLWELFRFTGDIAWLREYVGEIQAWMAKPAYWNEDYETYQHWVPQLGVYAIDLSGNL